MSWYQSFNFTEQTVPIYFHLPWNVGSQSPFGWICYLFVLSMGILLNGFTFIFINYNQSVQELDSVPFVKYLIAEDFFFSVSCLTFCSVNFHHQELYGYSLGCVLEAWMLTFFMFITSFSLCLIAFAMRRRVITMEEVKNPPIFWLHVGAWIFGAFVACMASVYPGSSRMNLSGSYCLPAYVYFWPGIFFFGVIIFPAFLFLITQYAWIFWAYQRVLAESKDKKKTTKKMKLARQLAILVVVYFTLYLPFLMSAIYEWVTQLYASVWFDVSAGICVHAASVVNPILYLWVTPKAKEEMKKGIGWITIKTTTEENNPSSIG